MNERRIAQFLLGPWMILPQSVLVAGYVGGRLYVPPEMHGHLERHLFLQGNTDWGGGCLFAGTIALYVAFGFTAAWYLVLALRQDGPPASFGRTLLRALWRLKFHVLAFILGGTANWEYDASVAENDYRNLFLFAALVYALSVLLVVGLQATRLSTRARLALAPLCTVLWLVVGSDGNTARAGQLVQSGEDPQPIVRSVRHGIMLSWHHLCDAALGDIGGGTQ